MQPVAVFDIGNVLIRWDPRNLYRKMMDAPTMERFLDVVCTGAWNLEQDRGRPWAEAEDEAIARHPSEAANIRAFRVRWNEMLNGAIEENVAVLRDIQAAGYPVYAITNFAADTFEEAQALFPFLRTFDGLICSGREGLIKPDVAIFDLFVQRFGLAPQHCVFIDDSAANIAGAQKVGLRTIHYGLGLDARGAFAQAGFRV